MQSNRWVGPPALSWLCYKAAVTIHLYRTNLELLHNYSGSGAHPTDGFPYQIKFDENFGSVYQNTKNNNRSQILHLTQQLRSRALRKILLQFDDKRWNDTKTKFSSNFHCDGRIVDKMGARCRSQHPSANIEIQVSILYHRIQTNHGDRVALWWGSVAHKMKLQTTSLDHNSIYILQYDIVWSLSYDELQEIADFITLIRIKRCLNPSSVILLHARYHWKK